VVAPAQGEPPGVVKTKTTHLLKYRALSGRGHRLKVKIEDGQVVGWDGELELPTALPSGRAGV
jgi:hypothetical protein